MAVIILLTFSFVSFGARYMPRGRQGQPAQPVQPLQMEPLSPASFNPALVGLNALRLAIPDIPPTLAGLGPNVERKLAEADPHLTTLLKNGAAAGITVTPQIVIYITKLSLTPNRPPVFSVRTTLSANVPVPSVTAATTTLIEVDVWSRADTIQATNINAELNAVTTLVNKHIDEFISDFTLANTTPEMPTDVNKTNIEQANLTEPNNPSTMAQYNFIASKSQLVFHKLDCPLVKNILAKNRIYFKTKEEAIAAGKKPCTRCKP